MSKLTKKDIKAIQDLGWSFKKNEDGTYFLENYSPDGGDMVIEGVKSKEEIIEYCDTYDPDDEFNCWYGAKKGEPSIPSDLWQDCIAKGEMYDKLKEVLQRQPKSTIK